MSEGKGEFISSVLMFFDVQCCVVWRQKRYTSTDLYVSVSLKQKGILIAPAKNHQ
jgi:hypothetical protein